MQAFLWHFRHSSKLQEKSNKTEGTETEDTEKGEVADTDTEWERSFNTFQTESTIPDESTPVKSSM